MKLLELSILEDGYTQPIVTHDEGLTKEVIDGFHRNRVGKESKDVRERINGYLPVVVTNEQRTDITDRMASTIRHNRARGKHKVQSMSDIVVDLKKRNWSDEKISKELGMDADEVLRLVQITGLAEMFSDREFSMSWNPESIEEVIGEDITEEELP
jgi:ParB-like chromosome segregation protein Spo0J